MLLRRCPGEGSPVRTLVDLLADCGLPQDLPAGARIFEAGQAASAFYLVESGTVRATRTDAEGREIEVERFSAGDFFGEVILFASETFPVGAEAVTACRLLRYPRTAILERVRTRPETAAAFLKLLARKCLRLRSRVEQLALGSARTRLGEWLAARCPRDGSCTVRLATSKVDLARSLGIAPETLSRNLLRLQQAGLIEVRGRDIKILDCRALREDPP